MEKSIKIAHFLQLMTRPRLSEIDCLRRRKSRSFSIGDCKAFWSNITGHFLCLTTIKNHKKKKTTLYKERNEEVRSQFIKKLESIPFKKRVYLDESGINQYLHRQHGRSARGKQVFGEVSGKRFGRQSVISALLGNKLLAPMCFEGTCDTDLFNVWIKQELTPNLIPGQVLILHNASFHKSAETKKLVEACGCEVLFLSPYSPDLNPIEKYLANMKTKIRQFLPTVATFSEALDLAVVSMSI